MGWEQSWNDFVHEIPLGGALGKALVAPREKFIVMRELKRLLSHFVF